MTISWTRTVYTRTAGGKGRYDSPLFTRVHHIDLGSAAGQMVSEAANFLGHSLKLGFVRSTGHRIRLSETDDFTVLLPRLGRLSIEVGRDAFPLRRGQLLALRPGSRTTTAIPDSGDRFEALVLTLSMEGMAALLAEGKSAALPDALWLHGPTARRLEDGLHGLAATLTQGRGTAFAARSTARMAALLQDRTVAALAAAADPGVAPPGQWRSDEDLVRTATRLMQAAAETPLSLGDLARDLGIGLRRLQQAFQRTGDATPREVLAALRLQRARDRLSRPDDAASVTDIAIDSGFLHLGRFSAQYRRTYGELPSETLARARRA